MDKYERQKTSLKSHQQSRGSLNKKPTNANSLCVILNIENAHLKAFVCPNQGPPGGKPSAMSNKYGEFDVKANNFNICVANSESTRTDLNRSGSKLNKKGGGGGATSKKSSNNRTKKSKMYKYRLERQYISIYTDNVTISHASKPFPLGSTQLKYPTNYATFETLFQTSKTKDLITANDEAVNKVLFENSSPMVTTGPSEPTINVVSVPMVSIGIKSKFNSKTNIKQLLVALNFNNLSLHHLFCAQQEYWIFQLIELFNLIDIDVIGYQVPTVLTELHLNVANSCVLYKPLYLDTRSLIAFKSLHWSSNVTAESTHTLLVFNIEDIYLFLSKLGSDAAKYGNDEKPSEASMFTAVSSNASQGGGINLKKDWICVANSDLFELRLLINEEIEQQVIKIKN